MDVYVVRMCVRPVERVFPILIHLNSFGNDQLVLLGGTAFVFYPSSFRQKRPLPALYAFGVMLSQTLPC